MTPRRSRGVVVGSLFALAIGLMLAVGFLGPSMAEPPLSHGGGLPPYFVRAHPSPWLVLGLLAAAFAAGTLLLVVALRALRAGWKAPVRALVVMGVIGATAFLLCPTIGSADYTNYSAYGHIQNRGLDAYVVNPTEAAKLGVPTASAVERPWQATTSVYGPTSVRVEQLAAWLGGASLRRTAWLLSILHCLAFLATGALLLGMAHTDRARRRVAVMWFANPLMIYELVAGSHVDALVVLLAVAGFAVLRRSRFLAGALVGLGIAAKVNAVLLLAGMAWSDRRTTRRLLALGAGAAVTVGGLYLTVSSHSLDQTRRAGKFVSPVTPWSPISIGLRHLLGRSIASLLITAGVLVVAIALGRVILRMLPPAADPTDDALRNATAYSLAYLLAAPYLLAWYDSLAWGTIPLVDDSPMDLLLVCHTAALSFAALPGRDIHLPGAFNVVVVTLHSIISPLVLLGTMIAVFRRGRRLPRRDSTQMAEAGLGSPLEGDVADLEIAG